VGQHCTSRENRSIVRLLERIGKTLAPLDLSTAMVGIPREVIGDKERISRFLLLVAILDQQAESPTARKTAIQVHELFGNDLFYNPKAALLNFQDLVPLKNDYKISPAIGRVLPRFGWIVLRIGAFLIYEMTLSRKKLSDELGQCKTPRDALNLLYSSAVIESVLRKKAARMYVSWIGHPDLGLDLSKGKWRKADFEMPVDGHVGKILSRTGMVKEIVHEGRKQQGGRWNIILASQMRPSIQEVVSGHSEDCIMVDHGAFRLGINCCPDNLQGIACDKCPRTASCLIKDNIDCPGSCLLSNYCKRNLTWRAY